MWTAEDIGKYIFLRSRRYAKREAFENVWVLNLCKQKAQIMIRFNFRREFA